MESRSWHNKCPVTGINRWILERLGHRFQNAAIGVNIVTVEDTDNIPRCHVYTLVHGIVRPLVGFGDVRQGVAGMLFQDIQSTVGGTAVDYDVFRCC